MSDYIDRQVAIDAVNHALDRETLLYSFVRKVAISALKKIDPAYVVQVVRCKDCKYRDSDDFCVGRGFPYQLVAGDEFCSRAKTKEHIND